jgi:predicted naringenin-chalcone synthase
MQPNTYLNQFKSITPAFQVEQDDARSWMRFAYGRSLDQQGQLDENKLNEWIGKYTVSNELIATRFTEIKDFTHTSLDGNEIFKADENLQLGVGLESRMRFFDKIVNQRASDFYTDQATAPDHMIHVSCTGYLSPSPLQRLCSTKGWHKTELTHAYHMGCYASMPSIRMADALSKAQQKTVDLFHSELCTLHFSTESFTPEQLIVQSLFADGYIGYKCSPTPGDHPGLKIMAIGEARIADSEEDMTWVPGDKKFNMSISRDVPLKLAFNIHEGLENIFIKAGVNKDEMMKESIFAIHPGGPKILDQVSMLLELQDHQIQESRDVLKAKGNMSSATLPHIWQKVLENKDYKNGQKVVSLAFGPGLTLFGSVFEITK